MSAKRYLGAFTRGRRTRLAALSMLSAVSLLAAACGTATAPSPGATPGATPSPTGLASVTIQVYFSKHPDSDSDPTAVFPLPRTVITGNIASPTSLPVYAIQQLIAGPTDSEKQAGYYTELAGALSGPSICANQDFTITQNSHAGKSETGTATLQFCRTVLLPGDLSGPRVKQQITRTLTQFPGIQHVVILDKSGRCFDDLSGLNQCLLPGYYG